MTQAPTFRGSPYTYVYNCYRGAAQFSTRSAPMEGHCPQAESYGDDGAHLRNLLQEAGDMHPMSTSNSLFQLYAVITTFKAESNMCVLSAMHIRDINSCQRKKAFNSICACTTPGSIFYSSKQQQHSEKSCEKIESSTI